MQNTSTTQASAFLGRGKAEELSKSLSRSRDIVDQNEVVTLGDAGGQDRLSPPQARLNMGIFGDFDVKVAAASQNGNNSLVKLSSEQNHKDLLEYSKTPSGGLLEELSSKLGKNYVFESQVSLRENVEAVNSTP